MDADFHLATVMWPQPLAPVHSLGVSAAVAAVPLAVVLVLMGGLRKSGVVASACGLGSVIILALTVWRMPPLLAGWSIVFGFAYAAWAILWLVFAALWLYNLAVATDSFDLLRRWMAEHASNNVCVQAMLVAFCFGALLEGSAGFGAPVAITAFLLVGLGYEPRKAVIVALLANTAPVAFGALGVPIIALAGVTGLDTMKLSAMVGRQLPLLSFILPAYLALMVGGAKGLRTSWPAALITGGAFAATQFFVSNFWGPNATDVLSAIVSILALTTFLRSRSRRSIAPRMSASEAVFAWAPWLALSLVVVLWTYWKLSQRAQVPLAIPGLHLGVYITLYSKPYPAVFSFQPLATGTGVVVAVLLTALYFRVNARTFFEAGTRALRQLRWPGLTVLFIVGVAYLYNYSGMAYTLGAAVARLGVIFPLVSSFLGWVACFLSGSDTSANLLFGNLQVAAARQLELNPVLMAATNSSGAVAGKMVSPQNIAIGVSTVGLTGQEGSILRSTFWHSVLLAAIIGGISLLQAYVVPWMVP